MNRRSLLVSAAGFALAPTLGRAQTAGPVAGEPDEYPIDELPGFVRSVTRAFELADPGLEVLLGGLLAIQGGGIEFETSDDASAGFAEVSTTLPEYFVASIGAASEPPVRITGTEMVDVTVGQLGDKRAGVSMTLTVESEFVDSLALGFVFIQVDRYLQVLVGYGLSGVMTPTIDIGVAILDRWPSRDLWDMVPTLDDVPVGMSLEEESQLP